MRNQDGNPVIFENSLTSKFPPDVDATRYLSVTLTDFQIQSDIVYSPADFTTGIGSFAPATGNELDV